MGPSDHTLTSIEICAGAGGQAIGLHEAGFKHLALVEIDKHAAKTLQDNIDQRDDWEWERKYCDVISGDVNDFRPIPIRPEKGEEPPYLRLKKAIEFLGRPLEAGELDLLAGGVPCPPFSHAGKQLGKDDERDLFPRMLALVEELQPKAVMIENVRGIKDAKFEDYRDYVEARLQGGKAKRPEDGVEHQFPGAGYKVCNWEVLEASNFGVPQLRPRAILVAIRKDVLGDLELEWPKGTGETTSVFDELEETMGDRYQKFIDLGGDLGMKAQRCLDRWRKEASTARERKDGGIAPTLVGGSKKHGGADLGPSRAKAAWAQLGVSGLGVANDATDVVVKKSHGRDLLGDGGPMLTVQQAAIIQGFPKDWVFDGKKTAQYRQVGNAFPPPVAEAVGKAIAKVLRAARERDDARDKIGRGHSLPGQLAAPLPNRVDDRQGAGV